MRTNSFLRIDEKRAVEQFEVYIRKIRVSCDANGVLMGLSGGLDSALLAALVVRALGKESLHVTFLSDRDTDKDSQRKARLVADSLGLELEIHDIEAEMRKRGIYAPLVMWMTTLSGFVNCHIVHKLCRFMFRESCFMSTLRQDRFQGQPRRKHLYDLTVGKVEAAFNARQVYRREVLEKKAKAENTLLLGAANRSESLTGWFAKEGVDDLAVQPLTGLYKTQVRQLASYLELPSEITEQPPSPDMMRGITDEIALGISYSKLDIILDNMESGLPDERLVAKGLTRREIHLVRELNRLSGWKRSPEPATLPVDGRAGGGLRVA